jgi:hypothetical protein
LTAPRPMYRYVLCNVLNFKNVGANNGRKVRSIKG